MDTVAKKNTGTELLADELAQKIRENIQTGKYPPDSRLTVRTLCEEFGTSETPVKQALNQLVTTGLVLSIPKCGMKVASFRFEDMKENLEARLMIELYCAGAAIERVKRDESFVTELMRILTVTNEEYARCAGDFTKEWFNQLHVHDSMLHVQLVSCCGNKQILHMYQQLKAHSMMFVGFDAHTPETLLGVNSQHTEIVEALLLCDEEAAKKAIRRHIYSTLNIYRNFEQRKE